MSKIAIVGDTGSGKTTSFKTLNPLETFVFNLDGKALPFASAKINYRYQPVEKLLTNIYSYPSLPRFSTPTQLLEYLKTLQQDGRTLMQLVDRVVKTRTDIKNIILDTATIYMAKQFAAVARIPGWDKYTDIFLDNFDLFTYDESILDEHDKNLIYMCHPETTMINGINRSSIKIPAGKATKDKMGSPEGLFTIVLFTEVGTDSSGNTTFNFITKANPYNTAKTPEGMFTAEEAVIPNDLQLVLNKIKIYETQA